MATISTNYESKLRHQTELRDTANSCKASYSCRASDVDADVQRCAEAATARLDDAGTQLWGVFLRDADNIYYGGQVLEATEHMIASVKW